MPSTTYYWDEVNDNLFGEEDENGEVVASYTHEPGLYGEIIARKRGDDVRYYNFDGLGNTAELTDEAENVTDTYEYSAFGEEVAKTGTTENPFGYKGALGYCTNSETKDIYVRARIYNPKIMRWLSLDPLMLQNRYRYVENNPGNYVDPSGLLSACCPFSMDVCNMLNKPVIQQVGDIVEVGGSYGIMVNFAEGCICDCDCCAIEVWIKGHIRVLLPDGTFISIPHPQLPGSPGLGLDDNEFRQDSPRLIPSNCSVVERDDPTVRVPKFAFDASTPNTKWDVHLQFKLYVIDICGWPELKIASVEYDFKITGPVKNPKIETSLKQCSKEQLDILK